MYGVGADGVCIPCGNVNPHCLFCNSNAFNCTKCDIGYGVSSGTCAKLCSISNCSLCSSAISCQICVDPYGVNAFGNCQTCSYT